MKCRLGFHCYHPRVKNVVYTSFSGKTWKEKQLEWPASHRFVQIHTADKVEFGPVDHDGMQVVSTWWKRKCCRCPKTTFWVDRRGQAKLLSREDV